MNERRLPRATLAGRVGVDKIGSKEMNRIGQNDEIDEILGMGSLEGGVHDVRTVISMYGLCNMLPGRNLPECR
jgi:hypothetical protein